MIKKTWKKALAGLCAAAMVMTSVGPAAIESYAGTFTSGSENWLQDKHNKNMDVCLTVQYNGETAIGNEGATVKMEGNMSSVFDGNTGSGVIFKGTTDRSDQNNILKGDYIQVDFKKAIGFEKVKVYFGDSNDRFPTNVSLAYTTTDNAEWVACESLQVENESQVLTLTTSRIDDVIGIRIISNEDKFTDSSPREWLKLNEIEITKAPEKTTTYGTTYSPVSFTVSGHSEYAEHEGGDNRLADDNATTYWQGTGSNVDEFYLILDLREIKSIGRLDYTPRFVNSGTYYWGCNGNINDIKIQVSTDESITEDTVWKTAVESYKFEDANGNSYISNSQNNQNLFPEAGKVEFDAVEARFVRIKANDVFHHGSNLRFTIADLDVYEEVVNSITYTNPDNGSYTMTQAEKDFYQNMTTATVDVMFKFSEEGRTTDAEQALFTISDEKGGFATMWFNPVSKVVALTGTYFGSGWRFTQSNMPNMDSDYHKISIGFVRDGNDIKYVAYFDGAREVIHTLTEEQKNAFGNLFGAGNDLLDTVKIGLPATGKKDDDTTSLGAEFKGEIKSLIVSGVETTYNAISILNNTNIFENVVPVEDIIATSSGQFYSGTSTEGGKEGGPAYALDGDVNTWWHSNNGIGNAWLTFTFNELKAIEGVKFLQRRDATSTTNGNVGGFDLYYSRTEEGDDWIKANTNGVLAVDRGNDHWQTIKLPQLVGAKRVKFQVPQGSGSNAFGAASEIRFIQAEIVSNLEIAPETKNIYVLGEELETPVVYVVNNIGGKDLVTDVEVSGYDANTKGVQTITVSYGDLTAEYEVAVYEVGDNYPNLGLVAVAGSEQPINGEKTEGPVSLAFDGNESTLWHTGYGDNLPGFEDTENFTDCYKYHWVEMNFEKATVVDAVKYLPRKGNGDINGYRIEGKVSADAEWKTLTEGEWTRVASAGEWRIAEFDAEELVAVRLVATSTYGDYANKFASAVEIGVRTANLPVAKFTKATASLKGTIGLNFYVQVNDASELGNLKVSLTRAKNYENGEKVEEEYFMLFEEDDKVTDPDSEYYGQYRATFNVAAKEMTDVVIAKILTNDDNVIATTKMSVKEYVKQLKEIVEEKETPTEKDLQLKALLDAMLYYGAAAQKEFNYNINNPASTADLDTVLAGIKVEVFGKSVVSKGISKDFVDLSKVSLLLKDNTVLRVYLTAGEGVNLSTDYVMSADVADASNFNVQENYMEITNISAKDLDKMQTFTITQNNVAEDETPAVTTVVYSPLHYAKAIVEGGSTDPDLVNVAKALYNYHVCAKAYLVK